MAADANPSGGKASAGNAGAGNHVFTYGSLMFPAVWANVVAGGPYRQVAASLPGFLRRRVRNADYPALVRARDSQGAGAGVEGVGAGMAAAGGVPVVDGVLYLDVAPADLAALDAFEGEDYRRIEATVISRGAVADGLPAGASLAANVYLFLAAAEVEPGDWDPVEFERCRIERFLREHPPPRRS